MPVEIREIVIKTTIHTERHSHEKMGQENDLEVMKKELLTACKRLIDDNVKRSKYKR